MEFLIGQIKEGYEALNNLDKQKLNEIRIRINKPVIIYLEHKEYFLSLKGKTLDENSAIFAKKEEIEHILALCFEHSLYLKDDEIKKGYISLKGGYRIGVLGTVSYLNEEIKSVRDIRYLNIRIPKEVKGCSKKLLPFLMDTSLVKNTLIIAPPKKGKTTLIRDIARELSYKHFKTVCVIDERNEISGISEECLGFDLGIRTDVLSGCKKKDGIMMAIRSMSPDVIVVDEIGDFNDFKSIEYAKNSGVSIIATMHGTEYKSALEKGYNKIFDLYVCIKENYDKFVLVDSFGKEVIRI